MVNVYFKIVNSYSNTHEVSCAAKQLLETVVSKENIELKPRIPLKVHFGERGNKTFIEPKNFDGVIDYLKEKEVDSCFIETNVLYASERTTRNRHIALAKEHGFTRLPIVIADGERGEEYVEVEINKKHFKTCKIGKAIAEEKQLIVLSHFKGHILAGFGGAIKQLGMGCAARPGKLEQHANSKPLLNPLKCRKCRTCLSHCPTQAIELGLMPKINKNRCIGCAACIAVCPNKAMGVNWFNTRPKTFREKLAEYAYAAQKNKENIYISFALNMTKDCDCDGKEMKPVAADIGVFASKDPVALDKACLDTVNNCEKRRVFSGEDIFIHAKEIGLGSTEYKLIKT